ncbi:MAG: hypothetical protein NWP82_03445, partial [Flavobacteriales bacterium]|nr:hypothetical protein [Flavobacteriales bacterium]
MVSIVVFWVANIQSHQKVTDGNGRKLRLLQGRKNSLQSWDVKTFNRIFSAIISATAKALC